MPNGNTVKHGWILLCMCTFDEASYLAKVSRSMINKWVDKGKFTVIKVGSRVRIRRDEFEDWMEQRDLERSMQ